MNNFFDTIISSEGLSITSMLICTAASLLLGLGAAAVYRLTTRQPSRNMFVTMLVLPVLIQAVIMLVNGSIGAGVAVMGAFSLVRFRSAPGSSRDICFIFYAVCIGLATGMGFRGRHHGRHWTGSRCGKLYAVVPERYAPETAARAYS